MFYYLLNSYEKDTWSTEHYRNSFS